MNTVYSDQLKLIREQDAEIKSLKAQKAELLNALKFLHACSIVAKHPEDNKSFYDAQDMASKAIKKAE